MAPRPCLTCGRPVANASRCDPCRREHDAPRYARRGTTRARGLSGPHARQSRAYRDADAACVHCGRRGTPANPITAGHIVARRDGGTADPGNYAPECRSCNSARH